MPPTFLDMAFIHSTHLSFNTFGSRFTSPSTTSTANPLRHAAIRHSSSSNTAALVRMGLLDALKKAVNPSSKPNSSSSSPSNVGDDGEEYTVLETTDTANIPSHYTRILKSVNALESSLEKLSDSELRSKVDDIRTKLPDSTELLDFDDETIIQVFAIVREAAFRVLQLRPYDVQILGALALHNGNIAEMATGEGKTLVAVLPTVLNSLGINTPPVLVVTVNDYLARRDAQFLTPLYRFFGLSVGLIQSSMNPSERGKMYACDIVYVTNSELGFDYLRDNLAMKQDEVVLQKKFGYCIVDEADSILIDEARTPLIISSKSDNVTNKYEVGKKLADALNKDVHYTVNEKEQSVILTEQGYIDLENALKVSDLFDPRNPWASFIINAVKAKELFENGVNYIVQDNEVQIIDEFTGRVMKGRRWSDGLHQAVEAKESLKVIAESVVSAKVSYQALFRLFPKLSGMTGTASTEASELEDVYKLPVITIPTALPPGRKDYPDVVFKNSQGKFKAVMREIARVAPTGRPILIGTTSVEASETLSKLLYEVGVAHDVLNARPKSARREAEIVAQAGRKYSITISTNMAGRGTDILLGGNSAYFARALARRELALLSEKVLKEIEEGNIDEGDGEGDGEGETEEEENTGILIDDEDLPADVSEELISDLKEIVADVTEYYKANGMELSTLDNIDNIVAIAAEPSSAVDGDNSEEENDESGIEDLRGVMAAIRDELEETVSEEREEVIDLGGLYVIGTDRAESRRVDNQLRGRSGRQGDPGGSRFFLALDDRLFRVFGGDKVQGILERFRVDEDTPIENNVVTKALDNAQTGVEEYFRGIREAVFNYDEVLSTQRAAFYVDRRKVLTADEDGLFDRFETECVLTGNDIVNGSKGDVAKVSSKLLQFFNGIKNVSKEELESQSNLKQTVEQRVRDVVQSKKSELDGLKDGFAIEVLRFLWLSQTDQMWQNHMKTMDNLKEMVGLQSYASENPLEVFQIDGFEIFKEMNSDIRRNHVYSFFQYTYKTPASPGNQ